MEGKKSNEDRIAKTRGVGLSFGVSVLRRILECPDIRKSYSVSISRSRL